MGFDFLIDNQFVERFSQEVPLEPELQIFRLWASSELPFGEHTIDVEIEELQNAAAVIDYFQVFTSGGARQASTTSGQTQTFATFRSSPSSIGMTSSVTVAALPTESSSDNSTSNGGTKAPIGPIVGGVIGGILVILLLALAAMWLRKRRRTSQDGRSEATTYEDTMQSSPTGHPGSPQDLASTSQSSSTPFFAVPQSKTRLQGHQVDALTTNPFLVPPQPKVRPSASNSENPSQYPSSSNLSPSTINLNSNSSQAGTSPLAGVAPSAADTPDDSRQVVEAIRTLQTYLQRQPEGMGQVAQGLGMATVDDSADTLNPPPAYEERH
jgi:hypothetical protein